MTLSPPSQLPPDEEETVLEPKPDRAAHRLVLQGVRPRLPLLKEALLWTAYATLVAVTAGAVGFLAVYYKFSDGLPEIPKVDEYWPPIVTEVHTDDAVLAGEFYNERRK